MFFSSKKLIGLDIGTANIKMAEMELTRGGGTLSSFSITPTPPRAITGGEITDPGAISDTLNQMMGAHKSKRKNAAVGLWGTSVITKRISIPQMDEKLVAGQIRWEAEQYIPFDINEVNVDFKTLKQFQASPETMEVMLVAARQDQAFLVPGHRAELGLGVLGDRRVGIRARQLFSGQLAGGQGADRRAAEHRRGHHQFHRDRERRDHLLPRHSGRGA